MSRKWMRACAPWFLATVLGTVAAAEPAAYQPNPAAARADVPADYQWRPEHLFATVEAWEQELAAASAELPRLGEYAGRLAESSETLLGCLEQISTLRVRLMKAYTWASTRYDADQSVDENKVRKGRIEMMLPTFGQTVAFVEPEILAMDQAVIDRFLADNEQLRVYAHYLRNVRRLKDHTLSPGEEKILALTGNVTAVPGEVHEAMLNVDIEFPKLVDEQGSETPLTLTGFSRYRSSPVYNVRRQAQEAFFGTLRKYENTLATSLDGAAKAHIMNKEARGYASCLEAALDPDDISTRAYEMLIETVNANLPRSLHKYISLRRKVLGLDDKVRFANLYNQLVGEIEENYPYEQARGMILAGLRPLGPDYLARIGKGLDPTNGWIDVYPNANKRGGAYSSGAARDVHPYVLHNYDNSLDAVMTTAHEFGHSLHSVYSNESQPPVYSGYTTFLAEVASTCNEALLLDHLLATTQDTPARLNLLNQRLESIRLTIFRQTLFAEFEKRFHEHAESGELLTAAWLNATYRDLVQRYYGPDYELGENDEVEWAFIPHFYYNFYVFSYATGLTSGLSLASQIERGGQKVADRYIDNLLKAGSCAPPLEILRKAGVDLETPQPILDMIDTFERTVDEFDREWTKLQAERAKVGATKQAKKA